MATYYVSTAGNDGNVGSIGSPFRTVNHGASVLVAGDTLFIRAGTYVESLLSNVPSGTSWANKVRIAAYPGSAPYEVVWLAPNGDNRVLEFDTTQQYIEFDGVGLDGTNALYDVVKINAGSGFNAHHIRIQNAELIGVLAGNDSVHSTIILATALVSPVIGFNEFINLTMHGGATADFGNMFYIQSSNNLIERCNIYDSIGAGVQLYDGDTPLETNNNIVRKNVIHDFTRGVATNQRGQGIIVGRGTGNLIYDNIIYGIQPNGGGSGAIYLIAGSNGTLIYNNTIFNNVPAGIAIDLNSTNAQVTNNIVYANTSGSIVNSEPTTVLTANFTTNPPFANTGVTPPDLHLASGSSCIDAGVTLAQVPDDFDGVPRPQGAGYDIGAYEKGGTTGGPFATVDVTQLTLNTTGASVFHFPASSHVAGNMLLVGVFSNGQPAGSVAVSSVTNTAGDVFTQVPSSRVGDISAAWVEWWVTLATAGNAADIVTVTMASAASVAGACHHVSYTGSAGFDTQATGAVAAATSIGVAITTTMASDYLAAAAACSAGAAFVAGPSFALRVDPSPGHELITEDRPTSAPSGTQTISVSDGNGVTQLFVMSVVAFKTVVPVVFESAGISRAAIIGSGII